MCMEMLACERFLQSYSERFLKESPMEGAGKKTSSYKSRVVIREVQIPDVYTNPSTRRIFYVREEVN